MIEAIRVEYFAVKVLVLTHGTRGDVQPFAALAIALRARGHKVILGAPAKFRHLVTSHQITYIPFFDLESELFADSSVRDGFETNYHGISGKRLIIRVIRRYRAVMPKMLEEIAGAGERKVDLVVHKIGIPGHAVAERIGVPSVPVCLEPSHIRTSKFPDPMLPFRVPYRLNSASYMLARWWFRALVPGTVRWRKDALGLPGRRGQRDPFRQPNGERSVALQAFSPSLLHPCPSYPKWAHMTGFWRSPDATDWTLPRELEQFLSHGDVPIYIGFGSLVGSDPQQKAKLVADAVRLAQVRAVIVGGSGGVEWSSPRQGILYLDHAPFDQLFPRMAAIVHHGGSGTIGLALRSGRPQVICPAVYGQPFMARQMYIAGVAPTPRPQRTLTAETLAIAIRKAMDDRAMAARAAELGRQVRAEDGVGEAIKVLESITIT